MRILDIIEAKKKSKPVQLLSPHSTVEAATNDLMANDVSALVVCGFRCSCGHSERDILKGLVQFGPVATCQVGSLQETKNIPSGTIFLGAYMDRRG